MKNQFVQISVSGGSIPYDIACHEVHKLEP
jgi:hypothetical protein